MSASQEELVQTATQQRPELREAIDQIRAAQQGEKNARAGTVYRHFAQRSDLIVAVFQTQVDACAEAASALAGKYEPAEALARWLHRYVDFLTMKRGLATVLHSGESAYAAPPAYFDKHLHPALQGLLDTAGDAKALRADIEAEELLRAVASLCRSRRDEEPTQAREMVGVLVGGLRYQAERP